MIRLYPIEIAQKLETGNLSFKLEVLKYLSTKNISIPRPLMFNNGDYLFKLDQMQIFADPLLPGQTSTKEDLSKDLANYAWYIFE